MIKHFCLSVLALLAFAGAAAASDLPTQKGPPPAPPYFPFSWSGFYIGGNIGGAWEWARVTDVNAYAAAASPGTVTKLNSSGVFGGAQAGYSWQFGSFVAGLEGDIGGMSVGRSVRLTDTRSGTRVGVNDAGYGDITARFGFAMDRALFYAKGGWAAADDIPSFSTVSGSFSRRTSPGLSSGGVIGAGVEYALTANWSLKAEYLYFDLPNANYTVFNAGGAPYRFKESEAVNTVKVGLNYRFDWAAPVPGTAKY
jgi:outer membrane immunogenic protein